MMPSSTSSSTSSRTTTNGGTGALDGGAALPHDTSSADPAATPLTAENLATHGASRVAATPSGSTASSTTTTFAFFSGLNEDDFNRRLDELRINRQAGLARLEADARAAQGRTRDASRRSASLPSPADTDPSSPSDDSGADTPSESSKTPSGSSDTPSKSSDGDGGSTTTSTPSSTTEATEHGDTVGQKLVKYLLGETNGMDVRNRRGWQELCLASGAAVGNNPFVCGEAIKKMNVNIFDVIEALETDKVARAFEDLETLARYSSKYSKIMEKSEAKAKPMLRVFLKDFGWALKKLQGEQGGY